MSCDELNIGKLRVINPSSEEMRRMLHRHGVSIPDEIRPGQLSDFLCEEVSERYVKIAGLGLCEKLENLCKTDDLSFARLERDGKGAFYYFSLHYNGGASHREVLQAAYDDLIMEEGK